MARLAIVMTNEEAMDPDAALRRLREGNERFQRNVRSVEVLAGQADRSKLLSGQHPFAVVLACSDSRAPAEIVFDQGLGDLFVIRVAGNIVAPSIVGSAEFAVSTFGTRLVVVMGHTRCGAVEATVRALTEEGAPAASENIRDIVERVRPAVERVLASGRARDREALLGESIRANVRASVDQLRHGSRILADLVRSGRVRVVGAQYDLASGVVDFFEMSSPAQRAVTVQPRPS